MELRGDISVVGGRVIIALVGVVDLGTLPVLRDLLLRAATEHPGRLLTVDLDAVDVLDDAGLGILLGVAGRLRERGGDLAVVASRAPLVTRLAATGFDRAVSVAPSLAEVPT
ncbi:MAG: STAS domain-containing protein [Desertimonas sp.]